MISGLALWGLVFALATSLPDVFQAFRVVRVGSTAGLSPVSHTSYLFSWAAWVAYGALVGDVPVVLSSVLGVSASSLTLAMLWRHRRLRLRSSIVPPAVCYLAAAGVLVLDVRLGGVVLAALDLSFFLPQMVRVFRDTDLSGISRVALAWEAVASAGWVFYAVRVGLPEAGAFEAAYGVVLAVTVLRLFARTRRVA